MLGALVNPDTLLVLIWTAFIYVGLRIVRHGPSPKRLIGTGAAAQPPSSRTVAGWRSFQRSVVLLGIAYLRWRPPLRQTLVLAAVGLVIAVAGLAVAGVFTAGVSGEGAAYGGTIGWVGDDRSFNLRQFLSYVWQFYLPKPEFMQPAVGVPWYGFREVYIQSFYSDFASLEIGYPRFTIDLLQAATMVAAGRPLHRRGDPPRRDQAKLADHRLLGA